MDAERVYKFYHAYKGFYNDTYDFKRYKGHIKVAPLIQQPHRRYFWRIAQKLPSDAHVHALFTQGFFFHPRAYVTDLATPEAFSAAVGFASRAENGRVLLEHECYSLRKYLQTVDLDAWLYGEVLGSERAVLPECVQMLISGELSIDLACGLLLIPQPHLAYDWPAHWVTDLPFSVAPWMERLKKADQLLRLQRPLWRFTMHEIARDFWASLPCSTLAPHRLNVVSSLF